MNTLPDNEVRRYVLEVDGKAPMDVLARPIALQSLIRRVARVAEMRVLNLSVSDIATDAKRLYNEVFEDEGGFSFLALISTSHIALHTWPLRERFMFDCVSCKPFNGDAVVEALVRFLEVIEITHKRFTP